VVVPKKCLDWPKSASAELDSDILGNIVHCCGIVNARYDGALDAAYLEMSLFKYVHDMLCTRSKFLDAVHGTKGQKTVVCDSVKTLLKRVCFFESFLDALDKAIEEAFKIQSRRFHAFLLLERDMAKEKFVVVHATAMAFCKQIASECIACACVEELTLEPLYTNGLQVGPVLERLNSISAGAFKSAWSPLANAMAAMKAMATQLDCAKFSFLQFETVQQINDWEGFSETYDICLNKICEIQGVRALARPVPQGDTPKSLAEKAISTISALEGTAPPVVSMLLQQRVKSE
jgi:hypothetical protein